VCSVVQEIEKKVRKDMEEVSEFALNSKWPGSEELLKDIYVNEIPKFTRGVEYEKSYVNGAPMQA